MFIKIMITSNLNIYDLQHRDFNTLKFKNGISFIIFSHINIKLIHFEFVKLYSFNNGIQNIHRKNYSTNINALYYFIIG